MRAICPSCETGYTIPDDRIGPKGRKVRCTRCGEEWRVMLEADPIEAPSAADADVGSDDPFADLDDTAATPVAEPASSIPTDLFDEQDGDIDVAASGESASSTGGEAIARLAVVAEAAVAPDAATVTAEAVQHRSVNIRVKKRGLRSLLPRPPAFLAPLVPFTGPAVFVASILICTALVVFRTSVVAVAPGLAGLYAAAGLEVNLRGLVFGPIRTLREVENGRPVLVVEGSLDNTTGAARDVPALRFALRDNEAQELYAWSMDPRATTIAPGDRVRFRTRLVAPPDRAADLQVRFVERRNRQAGL